ncbi:MAG: hypothetical protein ACYTDT_09725 [Planctomycetota bacterium]|jgi:hypothetical protein
MKGNLHFVVFGACVVIGIVLAFVGANTKSSATADITAASVQLDSSMSIPTKGDLEAASKLRKKYNSGIDGTVKLLRAQGSALTGKLSDEPPVAQYRSRAKQQIAALERRARNLELADAKAVQFPDWVSADKIEGSDEEPFKVLSNAALDLQQNEQVRPFQIRLVIVSEFITIAEALLKQPQFANGNGLRIEKFDFSEMDGKEVQNAQPFIRFPFRIEFDADPRLSAAIMDEFLNPSDLTAKSVVKIDDADVEFERLNFPVNLINYGIRQAARPPAVAIDLPREKALELGLPADMTTDDERWYGEMVKLGREKELKDKVRFNLPMRCELRLDALKLNTKWKAIYQAEEE